MCVCVGGGVTEIPWGLDQQYDQTQDSIAHLNRALPIKLKLFACIKKGTKMNHNETKSLDHEI